MVQAMVRSEDAQLACMAGFLKANGLAEKLLNKDWTGFARMYNGPSYWQNRYDISLPNSFSALPTGPRTCAAIKNFHVTAGLSAGEELDGPTYQALCKKAAIRPS